MMAVVCEEKPRVSALLDHKCTGGPCEQACGGHGDKASRRRVKARNVGRSWSKNGPFRRPLYYFRGRNRKEQRG